MVDRPGFRGCELFDEGLKSPASLLGLSGTSGRLGRENMEAQKEYDAKIGVCIKREYLITRDLCPSERSWFMMEVWTRGVQKLK